MSFKKSKLDLLVRVRYSNPLPAPPCPPKLLDIPTNPTRYARPEFLSALANDTALPMIVDAECGMPLDLGKWESLWEEDADDSALNPDPTNLPPTDPRDAFLLLDPSGSIGQYANGTPSTPGGSSSTPAYVPWLRKTEYISRETFQKSAAPEPKPVVAAPIDVSRDAQLRTIESSFAGCNEDFSISTLRHPNKPNVTAVDSYEVLPDADIWANAYDLFRFSERPGERPVEAEDPRLDCAILRPMESDGDHFLSYYLTNDDESAVEYKEARAALAPYQVPAENKETAFHFVRNYETVKVEQDVPNEFLLVLDDGGLQPKYFEDVFAEDYDNKMPKRGKGAYYKNIERKMILKKKRVNAQDEYLDKWEVIRMTHSDMAADEEEDRDDLLAEVVDPSYLMARGDPDVDAEGEIEVDEV